MSATLSRRSLTNSVMFSLATHLAVFLVPMAAVNAQAMKPIQEPITGNEELGDLSQPQQGLAQFYRAFNSRDLKMMDDNFAHSDEVESREDITEAYVAVSYGVMDMAPVDPIEGILIAQLMAANEAALTLYRKGWQNVNVPEFFEGGTKFLRLADKAARTVVLLTERLDHHRGRGQQQITVKHVTTNNVTADQAIIADSVTTGASRNMSPALLAAGSEMPMPILDETRVPDPVGVGGGKLK
jgi:hypothetical protein